MRRDTIPDEKNDTKGALIMAERVRNIPVMFYVNKDEVAVIAEKMKQLDTENRSAYLRRMAINGYVVKINFADINAHAAQLQKIGNNANQLVKRMNQTGSLYAAEAAEIQRLMADIWKSERRWMFKFLHMID